VPPQVELLKTRSTNVAVVPPGVTSNLRLASVNDVTTRPEIEPVALTVYVATNQFGRLNASATLPLASAMTSTLRDQELPKSSLTKMWTLSPGCQLEPVRVTSEPGA